MFKVTKIINPFIQKKIIFNFSNFSDPYYILGVQRNAQFSEIKKTFYKLANQFHPDKNPSQEAQKKFIVVKEAFERIKMQKGMIKPQNFYKSVQKQSIRPNKQKYQTDNEENNKNFRDYTVFSQKTQQNEQYHTFNNSFKTINDINEIKIKVQVGQMKDATSRFNLQNYKMKISSYSQSGLKHIFFLLTGLAAFTFLMTLFFAQKELQTKQNALKKLTQIQKRKTIQTSSIQNKKKDLKNFTQDPTIKEMQLKLKKQNFLDSIETKIVKDKVISSTQRNSI